ncbi:hypothetical protein ACS5PN_15025 [Roseateles sp. NT4]|uniref:hypothetical protein n=1 Tax=Roseateles sp. NT4 TaxID=3453715 RepID=UPI003EEFD886
MTVNEYVFPWKVFVFAPLVWVVAFPVALFIAACVVSQHDLNHKFQVGVVFGLITLPYAYAATLLVGLPMYVLCLLRRLERWTSWIFLFAGASASAFVACQRGSDNEMTIGLFLAGLATTIAACLLERRNRLKQLT